MTLAGRAALCLLLVCSARAQSSSFQPQLQVRSSFAGNPAYRTGGSGVVATQRFGANRYGGNTRVSSLNSYSGGAATGLGGSFQGSSFANRFFQNQLRQIENSFAAPAAASRPSSVDSNDDDRRR